MKRNLMLRLATFVALVTFLVACSGTISPKDPLWDREACAHCSMSVSEHRYATQIIGPGSTVRYYDDLGCALRDRRRKPELQQGKLYVRPFGLESWIDAADAKYIAGLRTPMGYGYGPVAMGGQLTLTEIEAALGKASQ